jgi:hypothetical protein
LARVIIIKEKLTPKDPKDKKNKEKDKIHK